MASKAVSLSALDKMKGRYKDKILNYVAPLEKAEREKLNEANRAAGKVMIEDITKYAISKYPLSEFPKCDSKHSSAEVNSITLNFNMADSYAGKHRREAIAKIRKIEDEKLANLERWYSLCLKNIMKGEAPVEFDVAGFEEVPDTNDYHNDRQYR